MLFCSFVGLGGCRFGLVLSCAILVCLWVREKSSVVYIGFWW